jgi:hypothetical protein
MRIPGAELLSRIVSRAAADFQPTEITGPSFADLTLEDHAETFKDDVDKLRKKLPNVYMADVMRDVNHSARTAKCELEMPTSDAVGFCWNEEDTEGTTWIPQGLSASWDADADGKFGKHRIIAASWYDDKGRNGVNRGSRITFVNYDNPDKPEYRHVLLVVPDRKGSFHAAVSHAGGLAWVGYKLYIADTDAIRVFDLHNIWRAEPDVSHTAIGVFNGVAFAADYRYAIPQIGYYRPKLTPPGQRPLRISCVSLDRTSSPNSLITAEYKEDREGVHSTRPADARIARWNLRKDDTLASANQEVRSSAAYVTSRANINGAITHGDGPEFVLTTSEFDRQPGWLHRATRGTSQRYTSVPLGGPEDLTYEPQGKRMWTLTEYDGRRTVFGIPLSSIGRN